MEPQHPKRKACDLCYRKKLKCDAQTPRCSTCVLYDSACTHKASSRKKSGRRKIDGDKVNAALQERLNAALAKVQRLETIVSGSCTEEGTVPTMPREREDIPPLQVALPLVETFLCTFNSVYPLFDPQALLRTFNSWYAAPDYSRATAWALINVVLALAHHTGCAAEPSGDRASYVHNAQSALSEVISASLELVNVQIILGLAILFWDIHNVQPSLVLTATALRLLHRLGLHSKVISNQNLQPEELAQGRRVFWMAYIVDRQISDLARVAPLQLDRDIDVDLPPLGLEDGLAGILFAADGTCALNFFRARIQLAQIQGTVYEQVHSVSAKTATNLERVQNVAHIYKALDDWGECIPVAFRPASLISSTGLQRYMCTLYAVRLTCRAKMSFASKNDSFHLSEWMTDVQEQSSTATDRANALPTNSPMSQGWRTLVDESREVLQLYSSVSRPTGDEIFLTMSRCGYFTGLICLVANCIFATGSDFLQSDQTAIDEAWAEMEEVSRRPDATRLRSVMAAVKRLRTCGRLAVKPRNHHGS